MSRDVVFDKNRAWKWSSTEKETSKPGMITFPIVYDEEKGTSTPVSSDDESNNEEEEASSGKKQRSSLS